MAASSRAVCVYCASADGVDPVYREAGRTLGTLLARAGWTVIYGGSRMGVMGALADGALAAGGQVVGIMPEFLRKLEIEHEELSEFHVVEDMRIRKHRMLAQSSAVVALPGGCGTFEELMEAITLRKLGVHSHPIYIINTEGYYDPLLALFEGAEKAGFFARSSKYFSVVATAAEAVAALQQELRS